MMEHYEGWINGVNILAAMSSRETGNGMTHFLRYLRRPKVLHRGICLSNPKNFNTSSRLVLR